MYIRSCFDKKREEQHPNIMGVGIECLGFMSKIGKKIINYVADRLALLKNEPKSIWVNRIRSNLLAVLMKNNAQMVLQCYDI